MAVNPLPGRTCRPGGSARTCPGGPRGTPTRRPARRPCSRVIENRHSTSIGARVTFRVETHTDARRRSRRFNVGRALVLNNPPAVGAISASGSRPAAPVHMYSALSGGAPAPAAARTPRGPYPRPGPYYPACLMVYRCTRVRQGLPLARFSAQPEPFLSLKVHANTQRIPQTLRTLSRKVVKLSKPNTWEMITRRIPALSFAHLKYKPQNAISKVLK